MFLPDIIITAYSDGFSGIYVETAKPIEAAREFDRLFVEAYVKTMNDLEAQEGVPFSEKYNSCPCPASTKILDDAQFFIRLAPLFLTLNDGTRVDNNYLIDALIETLGKLKNKFHDVSYYGLIAYEWFDEHCGDVVSIEISSEDNIPEDRTYPFIEEIFNEIFADEESIEEFWERFEANCYDITIEDAENIMACLKIYAAKHTKEIAQAQSIVDECVNED